MRGDRTSVNRIVFRCTAAALGLLTVGAGLAVASLSQPDASVPTLHVAGRVNDSSSFLGLVRAGPRMLAYVTDGTTQSHWFQSRVVGEAASATSSAGARLQVTFGADTASGTITLTGARAALQFDLRSRTGEAGLYRRAERVATSPGIERRLSGWVRLADGRAVGMVERRTGAKTTQARLTTKPQAKDLVGFDELIAVCPKPRPRAVGGRRETRPSCQFSLTPNQQPRALERFATGKRSAVSRKLLRLTAEGTQDRAEKRLRAAGRMVTPSAEATSAYERYRTIIAKVATIRAATERLNRALRTRDPGAIVLLDDLLRAVDSVRIPADLSPRLRFPSRTEQWDTIVRPSFERRVLSPKRIVLRGSNFAGRATTEEEGDNNIASAEMNLEDGVATYASAFTGFGWSDSVSATTEVAAAFDVPANVREVWIYVPTWDLYLEAEADCVGGISLASTSVAAGFFVQRIGNDELPVGAPLDLFFDHTDDRAECPPYTLVPPPSSFDYPETPLSFRFTPRASGGRYQIHAWINAFGHALGYFGISDAVAWLDFDRVEIDFLD